jgi:hypothetical protein
MRPAGGKTLSRNYDDHIPSFNPTVKHCLEKVFGILCKNSSNNVDGQGMDQTATSRFLNDIQHETATESSRYLSRDVNKLDDFLEYMSSSGAMAMAQPRKHDLSHPIPSYYISSSHNTYLTGNQLYSEASTNTYKEVLRRGCRCLEIDVWDGELKSASSMSSSDGETDKGRNLRSSPPRRNRSFRKHTAGTSPSPARTSEIPEAPEPRVLHGYTLTKEVSFRAVCHTIAESAFEATDLPLIVSLEVHASVDQQRIMIDIINEAWKGMLVDTSKLCDDEQMAGRVPSPDELRRKILVKVKWAPIPASGQDSANNPFETLQTISSGEEGNGPDKEKAKQSIKILHALSQLGVYTRAYSFKHFGQPEASIPNHVFSLSEAKVEDMYEANCQALFSHNRDHLMRAYPSGMRVNSSNLEPVFLWSQGIQIAALNWQKCDKGMMLNEGMFSGEEGWVLKPKGYRSTTASTQPDQPGFIADTIRTRTLLSLKLEFLAGQNIPLPEDTKVAKKFHPYVKCDFIHDPADEKRGRKTLPTNAAADPASKRAEKTEKAEKKYGWECKAGKGTDPEFPSGTCHFTNIPHIVDELSFVR